MKILKTENIKNVMAVWAKAAYPECEVGTDWRNEITISMKDVSRVSFSILPRRNIRVKGVESVCLVGGGVMLDNRRSNSLIIHGDAKSDFGVFDEVELKRRIDFQFNRAIAHQEEIKKATQVFEDKTKTLSSILASYGFILDSRYAWQKTWEYDRKIRLSLRSGTNLTLDIINGSLTEEEVLKVAKGIKEILNGELTNNAI
jgi:hypothetical protein